MIEFSTINLDCLHILWSWEASGDMAHNRDLISLRRPFIKDPEFWF